MPIIKFEVSTTTTKNIHTHYQKNTKSTCEYEFTHEDIDFSTAVYSIEQCNYWCPCRKPVHNTNICLDDEFYQIQNVINDGLNDDSIDTIKNILHGNIIFEMTNILNSDQSDEDKMYKINELLPEIYNTNITWKSPYSQTIIFDSREKKYKCSLHIPEQVSVNTLYLYFFKETDTSVFCCHNDNHGTYSKIIPTKLSLEPIHDIYNEYYKIKTNGSQKFEDFTISAVI